MITRYASILLVSCLLSTPLFANDSEGELSPHSQCINLVKECFVVGGEKKANCFFSAAHHPFCEGTPIGDLTFKRWEMSSDTSGIQSARSFLGPQLINRECVKNFDSELSAQIVNGALTKKSIKSFRESLEKCRKDVSDKLMRP